MGVKGGEGEKEGGRGRDDDPLNAAAQSMARLDRRFTDAISVLSTRFRHRPRLGNGICRPINGFVAPSLLSRGIINIPYGAERGVRNSGRREWIGGRGGEGGGRGGRWSERERKREESAQLVSTVADSKTPLSKEVRSTSKMVNGRPGVGQAFHDLGSRSHEKINVFPVFSLHSLSTR